MKRILTGAILVLSLLILSSCASTPQNTNNACAVLDQKGGLFFNWRTAAKKAERKYGIPMPIILATIYTESGFRQRVKPPRTKLLGFIPWKRPSSAYGYAQALDGTWEHYQTATGNHGASRTSFSDNADFIGWYHRESVRKHHISPYDAYALYLNYHMGHANYGRGKRTAVAVQGAKKMQRVANQYNVQLRNCGMR